MAHNINTYIGRQSAWHSLGTVTGQHFSWSEALAHGGLDYDVVKNQLEFNGKPVEAWGTFRTDNGDFLGAVGSDYTIIDHKRSFEFMDKIVASADGAHYETAGVLGAGEKVWGLIDLNATIRVGADETRSYLMFATAYDGSMSTVYKTVNTRVVCQNTLGVALSEKTKGLFRVRHTKNANQKLDDAHAALDGISAELMNVEQKLNFLAGRKVTREAAESIFERLFPIRQSRTNDGPVNQTRRNNTLADILARYESNDNNAFPEQRGTAYNLLNAITEYTDHARIEDNKQRATAALFGTGDKLKTQAFEVIMESANGMPVMKQRTILTAPTAAPVEAVNGSLLEGILTAAGI